MDRVEQLSPGKAGNNTSNHKLLNKNMWLKPCVYHSQATASAYNLAVLAASSIMGSPSSTLNLTENHLQSKILQLSIK